MSSKSAKKYKVKIRWTLAEHLVSEEEYSLSPDERHGTEKSRTYDFRTKQERDTFMKGVEQAIGWSDYEIVKDKVYDDE
jgi:hypothetical protein